jgi:hypothetical protein
MVTKNKDSVTFVYKPEGAAKEGTKVTAPYALAKEMGFTGANPAAKKAEKASTTKKS